MIPTKHKVFKIPHRLSAIIILFDLLAFLFSYFLSDAVLSSGDDFSIASMESRYYLFSYVICTVIFCTFGHYKNRIPYWQQIKNIAAIIFYISLITIACIYIFKIELPPITLCIYWVSTIVFLAFARSVSLQLLRFFKGWELDITLLGDNQMIIDCMYAFGNDGQTGFCVSTIMLRDRNKNPICFDCIPDNHPKINHIDATGDDYLQHIINKPHGFYIIDLEGFRGENRDQLIKTLDDNQIDYAIAPPTKYLNLYRMRPLYFFGNDVMLLRGHYQHIGALSLTMKRVFDIIISGFLLPFVGLFALAVYLLKKSEQAEKSFLYSGLRVGKNGEEFKCWKFSTMKPNADDVLQDILASSSAFKKQWELYQKIENDPRIDSKISKILRQTSLDEIPQIWNVFVGDMSLVGPRPIIPEQRDEYGETLPVYESFRPGLTGVWQVSGRNETTFQQRVYWDNWYVKNWSLLNDFIILFKTISVVLGRKGSG